MSENLLLVPSKILSSKSTVIFGIKIRQFQHNKMIIFTNTYLWNLQTDIFNHPKKKKKNKNMITMIIIYNNFNLYFIYLRLLSNNIIVVNISRIYSWYVNDEKHFSKHFFISNKSNRPLNFHNARLPTVWSDLFKWGSHSHTQIMVHKFAST